MTSSTTVTKPAVYLSWIIAAILVLLPFHALFTTWAGSNFDHLDLFRIWKEILLTLMFPLVAWLAWRSTVSRQWLKDSWIVRLFVLYVLLHLILGTWAAVHNHVNDVALIYSLFINLRFITFFILCVVVATNSDFLQRNWRKILLAPAAVVIGFGLMQKFLLPHDFLKHFGYGADTIPAYQTVDNKLDYQRIQSTLRGANPLGAYLLLIIPAFLLVFRKSRSLQVGFLLLGLLALFFSYSRSAWIGLVLSLTTLLGLTKSKLHKSWLVGLGGLILVLIVGAIYILPSNNTVQDTIFHTSPTSTSSESSNAKRLQAMESAGKDVLNEPLGRGPGTAGPASFRNDHPARIAENYFLQIGQEVGVAGIILFIVINVLVAMRLYHKRQDPLARILLAAFVGLTFVNLVSHAWTDDTIAYLWWGLAGVALATPAVVSRK